MWPFSRKRTGDGGVSAVMDEAIAFAAREWRRFGTESGLAHNIHLRDRVAFFAPAFAASVGERFPSLGTAPDEVLLLIIAKGIEASGAVPRQRIEKALGIILPP